MASAKTKQQSPAPVLAYWNGLKAEWYKIQWPTWPQIWGQTLVTILVITLLTSLLWVLDNTFRLLIHLITPHL